MIEENHFLRQELTTAQQGGEQVSHTERIDRACQTEVQRLKRDLSQAKADYGAKEQLYVQTVKDIEICKSEMGSGPGSSSHPHGTAKEANE